MREAAVGRVLPRPGRLWVMVAFGLAIWAGSAAWLWIGLQLAAEPVVIAGHALIVLAWAAVVAWVWFHRFGRRGPVDTALVFTGVPLILDFAAYAFAARGGVVLVESVVGVALPLLGVGVVVLLVGLLVNVPQSVEVTGLVRGFQPEVFDALAASDVPLSDADGSLHDAVTEWDPPRTLAYQVPEPVLPFEHIVGDLSLERVDAGVIVTWRATLRVSAFPLSGFVGRREASRLAETLALHLDRIDEQLRAAHRHAA